MSLQATEAIQVNSRLLILAAGVMCVSAAPALAHHSFGMFANDKVVTVTGTVSAVQWAMPHVWIKVNTPDGEWGFEGHSPNILARKGWSRSTLKPGDKVKLLMHPMRDGSKAGSLINATLPDGRILWNSESLDTQ
jgi:hypothetical protein